VPRFAGSPEVLAAAKSLAGEDQLEQFQHYFANLRSKGLSPEASEAMAMEALNTGQAPSESTRFRGIQGQPIGGDA
jgi:hypothetical protein